MASRKVFAKSSMPSVLSRRFIHSELYPKLWIRTCLNSGSLGSHSLGQKLAGSGLALHVFREPPPSPWMNIKSTNGSAGAERIFNPYLPRISSLDSPSVLMDKERLESVRRSKDDERDESSVDLFAIDGYREFSRAHDSMPVHELTSFITNTDGKPRRSSSRQPEVFNLVGKEQGFLSLTT